MFLRCFVLTTATMYFTDHTIAAIAKPMAASLNGSW